MIKIKKALLALEARVSALEGELKKINTLLEGRVTNTYDSSEITSYKEVIDQWLNGKQK